MDWSEDTRAALSHCTACPRRCGADRTGGAVGACGGGLDVRVARAAPLFWEEPCISGVRGSGAVFFCGCPVRCVFCQNSEISLSRSAGAALDADGLLAVFRRLLDTGVHSLDLVTPTHYALQLRDVLTALKPDVPVIWNCGGYESPGTLEKLAGLVDVYLTDFKFDAASAGTLCAAADYEDAAAAALAVMAAQTGPARFGADGLIRSGTMVRHLVLPGRTGMTRRVLERVARIVPPDTPLSLMSQYVPAGPAAGIRGLDRTVTAAEYRRAVEILLALGFENGYTQELTSAESGFVPAFDLTGVVEKEENK